MTILTTSTTGIATTARTVLVALVVGAATLGLGSCGDRTEPPAQQVRVTVPEPQVKRYEPACNTRAATRPCPDRPATGDGTRNRMQFADEAEPRR